VRAHGRCFSSPKLGTKARIRPCYRNSFANAVANCSDFKRMIRKSVQRFSEKIMRKQ
jgi:hypothetical protein